MHPSLGLIFVKRNTEALFKAVMQLVSIELRSSGESRERQARGRVGVDLLAKTNQARAL
jgi:hypothetical protein